jgi:hypothetical protein
VGAINNSKSGLNNVLQAVLSVANEEQSAIYPPSIFSAHYNIVTSFLLDTVVRAYPDRPFTIDIIDPYVNFTIIGVTNGLANLPDDYRNILGAPYIFSNPKNTGPCGSVPEITTAAQFQAAKNSATCRVNPVQIVSESEFSTRTNSTYNYPTHEFPIAYFSGKSMLRICPYSIPKICLLYTQQEEIYQFGYIPQPDDSYLFDPATTMDSLWTNSAFSHLFKGIFALYSAYVRDNEMTNFAQIMSNSIIL